MKYTTLKITVVLTMILLRPVFLLSQEAAQEDSIRRMITSAWEKSVVGVQAKSDYEKALTTYEIFVCSLQAHFTLEFPQSWNRVSGAATYIENKQLTLSGRNIVSSGVGVGLEQRLPGGGRISAETKYAFAGIADMSDFLQKPYFSAGITQPVGAGLFSIYGYPEKGKARLALENAEIQYQKEFGNFFIQIFSVMRQKSEDELICSQYGYTVKSLEQKHMENSFLQKQGRLSASDMWKTERELLSARRNLIKAEYEKNCSEEEWENTFTNSTCKISSDELDSFVEGLQQYLDVQNTNSVCSIEQKLLKNKVDSAETEYRMKDISCAPVVSLLCIAYPDSDAYYYYTPLNNSFDTLFENPNLWNFSVTLDLKYTVEAQMERKLRKKKYQDTLVSLNVSLSEQQRKDESEKQALLSKIRNVGQLRGQLLCQRINEDRNEADLDELYNKHMVTKEEYFSGKAELIGFRKDMIDADWDYLENIIKLAILKRYDLSAYFNCSE
jgi:hypothetical protein